MKYYREKHCSSWSEFKYFVEKPDLEWIFRGQSNSIWDLSTTIERSGTTENYSQYEIEILADFKQGAKFYLEKEMLPETNLEWFSLLQHFGAPSRLLDFTKSPYIAAFFAFEQDPKESEAVAVWVVDVALLQGKSETYLSTRDIDIDLIGFAYEDSTFDKIFEESMKGDLDCVVPMEPRNINQRYYFQQSIFLCQCNPYNKLIHQFDFMDELKENTVMKMTIPISDRKTAIRDLAKMNISRATLFPSLEGYAKSLYSRYQNLLTLSEMGENYSFAQSKGLVNPPSTTWKLKSPDNQGK